MNDDIGSRLRVAREVCGMSLHDAARRTKLSIAVIQAIERNDFASLPGGMFRKAYVRMLASEVGLDSEEMAAQYCVRFEPAIEPEVEDERHASQQKWIEQLTPSPRRSIVTLVMLAVPAAAWFMLQPGPVAPTAGVAGSELVAAPVPLSASSVLTTEGLRNAVAVSGAPIEKKAGASIEIQATGWCWVDAIADGERVLYRLVEPGERLVLEGQRRISLRIGDAGSVQLSINDGSSRTFGATGEVIELEVTPDSVDDVRAAPAEAVSNE